MNDTLWLVLDVGSSGVKAALMDDGGGIVITADAPYSTFSAEGGVVEQDADAWWKAVIDACHHLGHDRAKLGAVNVTGQMQDLVMLDAAGAPVHPVILYSDTRAKHEAAEIHARFGPHRLRALTANSQGADALYAKLLWVQRHDPDVMMRTQIVLFGGADAVCYRLTGAATCDTTTASTTGIFDIRARRWFDSPLLAAVGIEAWASRLPTVVAGGAVGGTVSADAAAALGIPAGIPVHHAPGDAGATTLGAGSGEIGRAYAYAGTSGWVGFSAETPGSPDHGVFTLAHPRAGRYMHAAPLLTAGGNLDWAMSVFEAHDYAASIDAALNGPITGVTFLPYLNGERAPFVDPLARAAFIGISPSVGRADLIRAVLEGVVFGYRHVLDALMAEPLERLILTGGATRSGAWCQLFADILGVPIVLIDGAEHASLRGAMLSSQVARGSRADYTLSLPERSVYAPDRQHAVQYDRKYTVYRAAYPALKPLFGMG
ncbi:MAG: hypothetical protein IT298_09725 [Chloroflexi bacterium]|nr:hypothetical protein [Chloroflexota bacterium]